MAASFAVLRREEKLNVSERRATARMKDEG
jgi:hypothetical protein